MQPLKILPDGTLSVELANQVIRQARTKLIIVAPMIAGPLGFLLVLGFRSHWTNLMTFFLVGLGLGAVLSMLLLCAHAFFDAFTFTENWAPVTLTPAGLLTTPVGVFDVSAPTVSVSVLASDKASQIVDVHRDYNRLQQVTTFELVDSRAALVPPLNSRSFRHTWAALIVADATRTWIVSGAPVAKALHEAGAPVTYSRDDAKPIETHHLNFQEELAPLVKRIQDKRRVQAARPAAGAPHLARAL